MSLIMAVIIIMALAALACVIEVQSFTGHEPSISRDSILYRISVFYLFAAWLFGAYYATTHIYAEWMLLVDDLRNCLVFVRCNLDVLSAGLVCVAMSVFYIFLKNKLQEC